MNLLSEWDILHLVNEPIHVDNKIVLLKGF